MSQGVYVLGGKCPGGKCPGGKRPGGICPWGKCPGGKCPGGLCPRTDKLSLRSHRMIIFCAGGQKKNQVVTTEGALSRVTLPIIICPRNNFFYLTCMQRIPLSTIATIGIAEIQLAIEN